MYAFDATYDETGAAQAERAFYVRSVLELRPLFTFGPPVFFVVVVAVALALAAPRWFVILFAVFLALSLLGPVFFYVARPFAARRLARKCPIRRISLTPDSIEIIAGGQKAVIAWDRVKYIWHAGDYLLLVLGEFGCISIPRGSLPIGAYEFIVGSVKSAA